MLPVLLVAGAVAGVALGVPMASHAVTSFAEPVALESTSVSAESSTGAAEPSGSASSDAAGGTGTVQMGVDGAPAPEAATAELPAPTSPAAATTAETASATGEESAAAGTPAPPASGAGTENAETADAAVPAPAAAPAATERTSAPADPTAEGQVLALVNQERATAGCAPLVADTALAAVARAHSADMRDRGFFSHTNPEGLSPFDRAEQAGISSARAENIAYGQPDAAAVMDAWMNSSGHRANILDCGLSRLGVGVAEGTGGPWWTQLFGS